MKSILVVLSAGLLALLQGEAVRAAPAAPKPRRSAPTAAPKPAAAQAPLLPSKLRMDAPFVTVNGSKVTVGSYIDRLSLAYAPGMREQLVAELLLGQEAERRKISVSAPEITALVNETLQQNERSAGGKEALERDLQRERGWSLADYRRVIAMQARSQIIRQKLMEALVATGSVTDAEIEKRYEERKDAFRQPERIRISHILLKRKEGETEAAARARAADLLTQVKAKPEAFDELARLHSVDAATAPGGGRVPVLLPRGAHPFGPSFDAAVFGRDPGIVSQVVATDLGFHVIRVDERLAEGAVALDEVKSQIRSALLMERRRQALDELLLRLRTEAKVDTGPF